MRIFAVKSSILGKSNSLAPDTVHSIYGTSYPNYNSITMCFPTDKSAYHILEPHVNAEFREHKANIVALAWAAKGFLLTASVDCTARLWHVQRQYALRTLQHNDFVTSVDFNPLDNGICATGCLD